MDDKTPVEQLLDKVAEALTKLLDFTEPYHNRYDMAIILVIA